MPMYDLEHRQATFDAAEIVRERGFTNLDSLFTPGSRVWNVETLNELYRRFVSDPDESSDSFLVKLERQLSGADDHTIQMMAEIFYAHLLTPGDIKGGTKRRNVEEVLSWMNELVEVPTDLDAGLNRGFGSAGMGFRSGRPGQLRYLIEFLQAWVSLDSERRTDLLSDPWAFKSFAYEVDSPGGASQKNALLYIMFPDTFEAIVSDDHKKRIVDAFSDRSGTATDVDQALVNIRGSLEDDAGESIDFYATETLDLWQPPTIKAAGPGGSQSGEALTVRRAWLVRPGRSGDYKIDDWLHNGYCGIGWRDAGEFAPGTPYEDIKRRVRAAWPDRPDGWVQTTAGNINRFVNQVSIGDVVVAPAGVDIYVGVVTSTPFWSQSGQPIRRDTAWSNPDAPIERSSLSASAFSKMRTLLTVTDISGDYDEFAGYADLGTPPPTIESKPELLAPVDVDFADSILLPKDWLNEIVQLLIEKRQVIFYGPPGTGKTFVAQALADSITGGEGATLVQFHPSYTYEDFFEGYRPQGSGSGSIGFELVQGPLRRIADAAADDPANPYVLIIDEVNRANLAKVFGELYFLLEYRDSTIALLYGSDNEFTLPKNLYIIGTMNTADRSIAFVDTAMRRRFYFIPFFPTQEPISLVLERWLEDRNMDDEPARLLEELNDRIDDDDFAIGPSYLMSPTVEDDRALNRIWDHAIIPLLEEHFFGTGRAVPNEFGLDSLRSALAAAAGPEPPLGDPGPDPKPS